MADVLLIVPAYNEAKRIASVLEEIRGLGMDLDVLIVDDGSEDATAALAASTGALVISHPFNLGYGAALQTGYKYAHRNGYSYAVQHDADGQHKPSEINKILEPVMSGAADVVIGSRFLAGGGGYKVSPARRAGIWVFSAIAGFLSGQRLTDVTSGFAAVNRRVIGLFASDWFPADYPDADVRLALIKMGLRVAEKPVLMRDGPHKSMHYGWRTVWYVVKMLITMFLVWFTHFKLPADKEGSK